MPDRFYCPLLSAGKTVRLEGSEAHHLARVLRKSAGDVIELFDGKGGFARAEILAVAKKVVAVSLLETHQDRPPVCEILLATAVPKGERYRWLVEKAVELNVDRLIPLITSRSVVKPGEGKREKMDQAVIEASKQCRRNRLMIIESLLDWSAFLETHFDVNTTAVLAHPGQTPVREVLSFAEFPKRLLLIVGPEGGLTEEEVDQAQQAGAIPVGLGDTVLRIETAAVSLAAWATFHRPDIH